MLILIDTASGRMNRTSATKTADLGSIPGRVKPKTIKMGIHSFPACVASTVCGKQVVRWQFDSKTERSLRSYLAKATW